MPVDPIIVTARKNYVQGYCCAVAIHLRSHGSKGDVFAKDMLTGVSLKEIELYAYKGDLEAFKHFEVLPAA